MYKLTITKKQMEVIREAMEFYSRCGMGQLSDIRWICFPQSRRSDEADSLLDRVKEIYTGLDSSQYHRLTSKEVDDKFRVAWDVNQVLRNQLSKESDPEKKYFSVWDYEPDRTSQKEPLPILEKLE